MITATSTTMERHTVADTRTEAHRPMTATARVTNGSVAATSKATIMDSRVITGVTKTMTMKATCGKGLPLSFRLI